MIMKDIPVLLIGVGPNAKRAYLPALSHLQKEGAARLVATVELVSQQHITEERLKKAGFALDDIEQLYVEDDLVEYRLSAETRKKMETLLEEQQISAVIISTDPLAHKAYALWALEHNLPILMDKPISTQRGATHDPVIAKGIYQDYVELAEAYSNSTAPLFSINVQRRHHPGFQLVFDKVAEIAERFAMPITAIQSTHADGQWRLPEEVIDLDYHGYNRGVGKVSHSGYHFIDIIAKLIKLSYKNADTTRKPDSLGVFSSFVEPRGMLTLNPQENYHNLFGPDYAKVSQKTTEELREAYQGYGEVDASSILQLLKNDEIVANITLNLIHNSFSRRSWLTPNADLYKGNGRVKHEYHSIQQGPLQNIQIHSYQKNDKHDKSTKADLEVGGNNHFDILIFRNNAITGDKEPFQKITMADFNKEAYGTRYVHDAIKHEVVEEFIDAIRFNKKPAMLTSPFEDQELAALLMSMIYQSGASRKRVERSISSLI